MANPKPKKSGADANPNGTPPMWMTYGELYKVYSLKSVKELEKLAKSTSLQAKQLIVIKDILRAYDGKDRPIDRVQDRSDGRAINNTNLMSDGEPLIIVKTSDKQTMPPIKVIE